MYLNEREALLLSGLIEIELHEKDRIKLAKSFKDIVEFKCSDENLSDEATMNTLLTLIPKANLLSAIKSIRPDLSKEVNSIQKLAED